MTFGVRLNNIILDKYKNIREFVEKSGMNRTQVDLYLKDKTIPSIKKVEEFASILNVSASWLAYGEDLSINKDLLVIENINLIHVKIEKWLEESNKEMDPIRKAELAKLIYQKLKEEGSISESKIEKVISILNAA